MQVNDNRLEHAHNLLFRQPLGTQQRSSYTGGAKRRNGFQVTVKQCSRRIRRRTVIKRNLRLAHGKKFRRSAFGYIKKRVNLVALYSTAGFSHTGITRRDFSRLESVKFPYKCACCRGIVVVNHTHGHVCRLAVSHKGREEYGDNHRKHNHAEQIHQVLAHYATLAARHTVNPFKHVTTHSYKSLSRCLRYPLFRSITPL